MELIILYTIVLLISLKFTKRLFKFFKYLKNIPPKCKKNINYFLVNKKYLESFLFKFLITYIPYFKNKFNQEIEKAKSDFYKDNTSQFEKKTYKLPVIGMPVIF